MTETTSAGGTAVIEADVREGTYRDKIATSRLAELNAPTSDVVERRLDVLVDDAELERRRSAWQRPAPNYTTGVLAKYAALVSGADRGAVCTVP